MWSPGSLSLPFTKQDYIHSLTQGCSVPYSRAFVWIQLLGQREGGLVQKRPKGLNFQKTAAILFGRQAFPVFSALEEIPWKKLFSHSPVHNFGTFLPSRNYRTGFWKRHFGHSWIFLLRFRFYWEKTSRVSVSEHQSLWGNRGNL